MFTKKTLIMKLVIKFGWLIAIIALTFTSCNKDSGNEEGIVTIGITDLRGDALKAEENVIDPSKLAKFEITISRIELRKKEGGVIDALSSEVNADLRNYKGIVKELPSINLPVGDYTGAIIYFSGISLTYDGNNYTSSITGAPIVTLADFPTLSFSTAEGVPNSFDKGEIGVDFTFDFQVLQGQTTAFNISIDAVGACSEVEFNCQLCPVTQLYYFARLRPIMEKHMGLFLKEGIQQIKYSPPLDIKYDGVGAASYHGIHTFIDFSEQGGTITAHTSQHVYRGTDGFLSVDAETMTTNNTTLTPNSINATGTTDVRADEVFDFSAINATLTEKGYTLEAGKTYYFSLRKEWTINTDKGEYKLPRMCEPIPVIWPPL